MKILYGAYNFYTFVQKFEWTSEFFFFNFRFSDRKSQSQQKLAKKVTYFTIQFHSKNLTRFTNLNSLNIENNMLSQHRQKTSDSRNFPANMFLFGVRKNICTAPFLDAQELDSWSTLKANVWIFMYISIRKLLLQRRSKILFGEKCGLGGGWGRGWIISLKQLTVWVS